jgi:phosphatidylglycerophosphate synthase
MPLTPWFALKAAGCAAGVAAIAVARFSRANHPHQTLGPANYVTAFRTVLVALVAGAIGEPNDSTIATGVTVAAIAATLLDGLDGWLARRSGMTSAFGARFDMEVDALLIMALSVLAWTWDKAGAWVLASGLLRYVFVVAGWIWPWMERPLEASRRRQTVCVIQIVALILVVSPVTVRPASALVAAAALAVLAGSFFVDTSWLVLHRREQVA